MTHVDYPPQWITQEVFERITDLALEAASHPEERILAEPITPAIAGILRGLEDLEWSGWDSQERKGASYRSIGYLAKEAGLSNAEISTFYSAINWLSPSQRHVGHMITRVHDKTLGNKEG